MKGEGTTPSPSPRWYRLDLKVQAYGFEPTGDEPGGEKLMALGHTVQADNLATACQALAPSLAEKWDRLSMSATIADLPVDHTLPTERRREVVAARRRLLMAYAAAAQVLLPVIVMVLLVLLLS